jgi:hypothetical protein
LDATQYGVAGVVFEYDALEGDGDDASCEEAIGDDIASIGYKDNEE